jgi:putative Holliday junction resolvase
MIFTDLKKYKSSIKQNTRILGVDFGTKNIGLSISDKSLFMASPLCLVQRKTNKRTIECLKQIILENNVTALVFGLPLNSDDEETSFCKNIRMFVGEMDKGLNIPIYFYDEFLTSGAAESILFDELNQKYKTAKKNVDKVAATVLLQDFLTVLKNID